MDSHITLLGSIIITSLLFVNVLNYQSEFKEHTFRQTNTLIVQNIAIGIIEVMEHDFHNIGFGVNGTAFAIADSNLISYYVDLGADGTVDSVTYFISDTTAAATTPNPLDKILYRVVNNQPLNDAALGVTHFRLRYFDHIGIETNDLDAITTIEVSLEVQNTIDYDGQYSRFFCRERISPPSVLFVSP